MVQFIISSTIHLFRLASAIPFRSLILRSENENLLYWLSAHRREEPDGLMIDGCHGGMRASTRMSTLKFLIASAFCSRATLKSRLMMISMKISAVYLRDIQTFLPSAKICHTVITQHYHKDDEGVVCVEDLVLRVSCRLPWCAGDRR